MDGAACVQLCSDPPIFKYKLTALTFRICLVPCEHLSGRSAENLEMPRNCQYPSRESNHGPPEQKSEALPVKSTCSEPS